MINIAILGFGVVGSGVAEVIEEGLVSEKAGKDIIVKKILDVRDHKGTKYENIVTADFSEIENDDEISIVVECIGGVEPANTYTRRALQKGKYVVTSNKELVATYGAELIKLSRDNGVCYMFEASVGGGIPLVRPLIQCLISDDIGEIMGILNGTTNYILSQMAHSNRTFEQALKEAQLKGYAERDPSADVDGHDTCRKIAILSSLCYGKQLNYADIPTKGIAHVTLEDIKAASERGGVLKLVGRSRKNPDGSVTAEVSPMVLPAEHPLAGIEDVFNGVLVTGSVTGDVMFYGRGAGKRPTASAVIADIVDIIRNGSQNAPYWV